MEEIILGSGTLYVEEFTGEIPTDAVFETEANRLGLISGGCSIEYKPTFYEAKDDLGKVSEQIITSEDATLKSGICTFTGKALAKLCATARITENIETGITTIKFGGIANDNGKKYAVRFVHISGKRSITIVGKNQAGFTLAFAKDKETVVDVEFKAMPCDSEGTLIIYQERVA